MHACMHACIHTYIHDRNRVGTPKAQWAISLDSGMGSTPIGVETAFQPRVIETGLIFIL